MSKNKKVKSSLSKILIIVLILALFATVASFLAKSNGAELICFSGPSNYNHLDEAPLENKFLTGHGFPKPYFTEALPKYCGVTNSGLPSNEIRQTVDESTSYHQKSEFKSGVFLYDYLVYFAAIGSVAALITVLRKK
jgi:hypothetical protein